MAKLKTRGGSDYSPDMQKVFDYLKKLLADGKKLDLTYRMAWYSGLKTTYYLRSIAATTTEKSTINQGSLNAVSAQAESAPEVPHELGAPAPVPEACSLDDPDCEACQ